MTIQDIITSIQGYIRQATTQEEELAETNKE